MFGVQERFSLSQEDRGCRYRKMTQKQKHSTKFDFSGTNYEIQTLGYLVGIEEECKLDPNLFKKICEKAKKVNGA